MTTSQSLLFTPENCNYPPAQIGSLNIAIYGYFLQREQEAYESIITEFNDAIDKLQKLDNGSTKSGDEADKLEKYQVIAKDTTLTNKLVSMFLRSRVSDLWTPEAVKQHIPWNYVAVIYDLLKAEQEASALRKKHKSMIEVMYLTDPVKPTGESSD